MCLTKITSFHESKPLNLYGWKLFRSEICKGGSSENLAPSFFGARDFRHWKCVRYSPSFVTVWWRDASRKRITTRAGKSYRPGFHFFTEFPVAKVPPPKAFVILPIFAWGVHTLGEDRHSSFEKGKVGVAEGYVILTKPRAIGGGNFVYDSRG